MSLYAVKNDEGKWLRTDTFGTCYWKDEIYDAERYIEVLYAHHDAKRSGGHVVELVEAPAKEVVSEEEAEMLERAKNPTFRPSSVITSYSNDHDGWDITSDLEDRLMRAYVNGWTVEKPKRFNVKVPHTKDWIYQKYAETSLVKANNGGRPFPVKNSANTRDNQRRLSEFTLAEIEHYGLQDCEKVVCADSARTTGEED